MQLCQEPTLAFPRSDQEYLLITNSSTPTTELPGGLCATLAQRNNQNQIQVISHASRQSKENKKNYTSFLLETAAAVWGMDNFNEYLKGSQFTLYMDPTLAKDLGTAQMKTWNRLKTAMSERNFNTQNCQNADLPQHLKQRQRNQKDKQHITTCISTEQFLLTTSKDFLYTLSKPTGSINLDFLEQSFSNKERCKSASWSKRLTKWHR